MSAFMCVWGCVWVCVHVWEWVCAFVCTWCRQTQKIPQTQCIRRMYPHRACLVDYPFNKSFFREKKWPPFSSSLFHMRTCPEEILRFRSICCQDASVPCIYPGPVHVHIVSVFVRVCVCVCAKESVCVFLNTSSSDHAMRLIFGSSWFLKRSLHCLPLRPTNCTAMTAHLRRPCKITSFLIISSSCAYNQKLFYESLKN